MDPSNFNNPGGRRGSDKSVTEQDLISKLEHTVPSRNLDPQVDCTLKLGLPQPQPQQAAAAASQMGHDYGNIMTERVNANQGSPGGMNVLYGGGSGPSIPVHHHVICNNYGNLYYMNPQNNVAVNNNMQAAGRNEGPGRKCMVCQASSTPLWRRGPDGEKSLCNACGIRYRKDEKKKA